MNADEHGSVSKGPEGFPGPPRPIGQPALDRCGPGDRLAQARAGGKALGPGGRLARVKAWLIPLGLLALALAVRLPGLGTFNTADEPLWVARSQPFIGGLLFPDYACPPAPWGREFPTTGLGCTLQIGYPGVTTMAGGGLGLLIHYWQTLRPAGVELRSFLESPAPLTPALIALMRLPLAVAGSLLVLLFYLLVRRLFDDKVALISTLLVALSPFHIALSRLLHHDALTAHFMVLSLLSMAGYWLQGWKQRWLFISAILAGIAFLSKAVSWFMMPCAAMLGLLSLAYRRRQPAWRGWASVGQVIGEGALWGAVAWLTFAALFPAMWVIPGEVISRLIETSSTLAERGHETDQYFLGNISRDPGPLLYPIGWLLRASPLEVVGLLILPVAVWRSFRQKIAKHPAGVALALFVATFLVFLTLSNKKMARYFLPAFPVIDIFAALGLLWLTRRLAHLVRAPAIQRWALPALSGLVLLGQGWLAVSNYPYYLTYYNPLLGGAPGAARFMDVGWGEGLNEAAAYLNQQPGSQSLQVSTDYRLTFSPFFGGGVKSYTGQMDEAMKSDYLVFYRRQLQSNLHDPNLWRYFDTHYTPVWRVTLQGLDYALVYRNPIQQHICTQDNSRPDVLTPFGYNLAPDGGLTLFWQNLKGGRPEVQAGLTSAAGETRWVTCTPAPAFAAEADLPGALLESQCPLAASGAPPGFYDLRLDMGSGGRTVTIRVDTDRRFSTVAPATAAAKVAQQGLVIPLDLAFGSAVSLAGYRLEPTVWRAGDDGGLVLYWQLQGGISLALADQFRLSLRLFPQGAAEPVLTAPHPILKCMTADDLAPGTLLSVRYPLPLPATLPPGAYTLQACLIAPGEGQTLNCLPLPVNVIH